LRQLVFPDPGEPITVTTAWAGKFTAASWDFESTRALTESILSRGTNLGAVMTIKIPEGYDKGCNVPTIPAVI
jgi:hypothetical protein